MAINEINKLKTIKEVEEYKKSMNEACDKRMEFINACVKADELSKKSFGYIKEAFESISPMLFETAQGKKIINKYTKAIRENKNLSSLQTIYENIRKSNKNTDIDFFVNSIANENWEVNKKDIDKDTYSVGRILAEAYLYLGKDADEILPEENQELYTAVKYITENKKGRKNLSEYGNAVKVIRENVEKNEGTASMVSESLDKLAERLLREFNEKYSGELTEEEVNLLKEVSKSNDKEKLFNEYKEQCKAKISEARANFEKSGDSKSSERLAVVLEQVSNKQYSSDTISNDICALLEISNIF